jgi:ELWxxDGT repeat protein
MKKEYPLLLFFILISSFFVSGQSNLVKVVDVNGNSPIYPNKFIAAHGLIFFADAGQYLWTTDGTAMGTHNVTTSGNKIYLDRYYVSNGSLFFTGYSANNLGNELYKYDATFANYALVKDIYPGTEWSRPDNFMNVGNTLYFSADDGTHGNELWKTDGTEAGTVMVKDIYPGVGSSNFSNAVAYNNLLYFSAIDPINGYALWKSDGTEAGTVLVKDCNPNPSSTVGAPQNLLVANNLIYFAADDGTTGRELWRSDGTAAGTYLVKDLVPGKDEGYPQSFVAYNGLVFFLSATTNLWATDGTPGGTVLLKVLTGYKISLSVFNTKFYVNINTSYNPDKSELWTSDGTPEGTVLISAKAFTDGVAINNQFYRPVNKTSTSGFDIVLSGGTECKTKTVYSTSTDVPFAGNSISLGTKLFMDAYTFSISRSNLYMFDTKDDLGFSCQPQTLSFATIPAQKYNGTLDLAVTASSGLPASYLVSDINIATLANNKLTFVGVGNVTITAMQQGSSVFEVATPIPQTIIVGKADQTIDFATVSTLNINSPEQFTPTATSGLTIALSTSTPNRLEIVGSLVTPKKGGKATVVANQAGSNLYNPAIAVSQTFCIRPITPIVNSDNKADPTLFSSNTDATTSSKWYNNGVEITGAVSNSYKPIWSGTYTVQTFIEGCPSNLSEGVSLIVTGLENGADTFELFPNPIENKLNVNAPAGLSEIIIRDIIGRVTFHDKYTQPEISIDLSEVPSGIYLVELKTVKQKTIQKIIKR